MSFGGTVQSTKGSSGVLWQADSRPVSTPRAPKLPGIDQEPRSTEKVEEKPIPKQPEVPKSTLNAEASEFVPRARSYPAEKLEENLSYLKAVINDLSRSPERYGDYFSALSDIAQTLLVHDNALWSYLDTVIEQCIEVPNFRHSGARLCSDLSNRFNVSIINVLLTICREKFESMEAAMTSSRGRVAGFGVTIAELYYQITIGDGKDHIRNLAEGVIHMLRLLVAVQAPDTLKAACDILKLCGVLLEKDEQPVQLIYSRMEDLLNSGQLDRRERAMLDSLIGQRKLNGSNNPRFRTHHYQPVAPVVNDRVEEDILYLKEAVEVLTASPDRFEEFLSPLIDIAEGLLNDPNALAVYLDIVLEQCITEANFRYTGARLYSALCNQFALRIISVMLPMCSGKFESVRTLTSSRSRACGFGLTMAELFLQVTIGEAQDNIESLGRGVSQMLALLLSVVEKDTLKSACQILKLCGTQLERKGLDVNSNYSRIEYILENEVVDENMRFLLNNVLKQRHSSETPDYQPPRQEYLPSEPVAYGDPVFYGPDGAVLSEEESLFLRDNIPFTEDWDDYVCDDESDDEMIARFDEFLDMSRNSRNGT